MKLKYEVTVEEAHEHRFNDRFGAGCYLRETWRINGDLSRASGPSIILRHPVTGYPAREEFFANNQRHRMHGGPAIVERDPYSGTVTAVQYFEHGDPVPGPNEVTPDGPQF
ncbi:hypothetical protein [Novosphingobium beihaiensis]|uniref:Uncharacterized protein n=1 Tax=Novosphingobium beihaiensis TaxID=2930389 RepID=A0ABT0BMH0_9SPHN|nr:hypothetical protein [Novosphingobium beihaiensis]MCJ2186234.1 hypothetical protein [Novosphingobium beihaiensis]